MLRPLPNSLHSVGKGPDDRSQPCVSDIDSPVCQLFDLSISSMPNPRKVTRQNSHVLPLRLLLEINP
jgi:hypothetical protein